MLKRMSGRAFLSELESRYYAWVTLILPQVPYVHNGGNSNDSLRSLTLVSDML